MAIAGRRDTRRPRGRSGRAGSPSAGRGRTGCRIRGGPATVRAGHPRSTTRPSWSVTPRSVAATTASSYRRRTPAPRRQEVGRDVHGVHLDRRPLRRVVPGLRGRARREGDGGRAEGHPRDHQIADGVADPDRGRGRHAGDRDDQSDPDQFPHAVGRATRLRSPGYPGRGSGPARDPTAVDRRSSTRNLFVRAPGDLTHVQSP